MKKRIWFNRWFSTLHHYIELIKNNPDGIEFEVYGTYPTKESVYLQVCDHVEIEPPLEGRAYVDYCLDFCKRNKIDIFAPRLHMPEISKYINEFEEIGVKVLASSDGDLLELIEDKAKFYESFKQHNILAIPDYYVVNTAEEFAEAYKKLSDKGLRVCFKPVKGEGANGFRVIDNKPKTVDSLFGGVNRRVQFEEAYELLSSVERFDDLMVLEYLDGYEYSIDCVAYNGKLLAAIPRKKLKKRVQFIDDNPQFQEIAKKVAETYKLPYAFNIQFKYSNGVPKLLEINPRMSGGLHFATLTGVNMPYLAIKSLLEGDKVEPVTPKLGFKANYIETPVYLNEDI